MRAWLTTVVARVSLNMLRSRKSKREEPLAVHVPEPIVSEHEGATQSTRRCLPIRSASPCS